MGTCAMNRAGFWLTGVSSRVSFWVKVMGKRIRLSLPADRRAESPPAFIPVEDQPFLEWDH